MYILIYYIQSYGFWGQEHKMLTVQKFRKADLEFPILLVNENVVTVNKRKIQAILKECQTKKVTLAYEDVNTVHVGYIYL